MNLRTNIEDLTPVVHLNGTGGKDLLKGWSELQEALQKVVEAADRLEFNARDYYPRGDHAWPAARDTFQKCRESLKHFEEISGEVAAAIADILEKRGGK